MSGVRSVRIVNQFFILLGHYQPCIVNLLIVYPHHIVILSRYNQGSPILPMSSNDLSNVTGVDVFQAGLMNACTQLTGPIVQLLLNPLKSTLRNIKIRHIKPYIYSESPECVIEPSVKNFSKMTLTLK